MIINNNISAVNAFNILNSNNKALQKSIQALSSGLRINSAADDASGLAISEKMRSQIRGLDTALKNSQDGISLIQTAEGALESITSILQRMRELSVQAANDTLTQQDRAYIQKEVNQLKDEINRTAHTTQFNKKKLLNGNAAALWSSSHPAVKARVNGTISGYDNFGQDISAEGNYKLDITSTPGKAQVLSGRMFAAGHSQTREITETLSATFTQTTVVTHVEQVEQEKEIHIPDLGDGDSEIPRININTGKDDSGKSSGNGWNYNSSTGRLTITGNGQYYIYGTGEVTRNHIYVNPGVTADVIIDNVQINTDNNSFYLTDAAFLMDDAEVNLYLVGTSCLHSGYHRSALEAPEGSKLTINSAFGDGDTKGELNAVGGTHGSGIGGCCCAFFNPPESNGGNIIIRGGTINARGGDLGAGIGGGQVRDAGTIEIYGGQVNAYGGYQAAGIGSSNNIGDSGSATVIIAGGKVYAEGKGGGAGIGGGAYSGAGTIKISSALTINQDENSDVISKGSTPYSYPNYYSAQNVQSATAGDDIGAGIGYVGDYTGYSGDIEIPKPDIPVVNWKDITVTEVVEVEVKENVEEVVTMSTDVTYEEEYAEENTLADFLTKAQTTSAFTESTNPSPGAQLDDSFMSAGYETLRIIQGSGKETEITLYSGDKMSDIAKKINDAIATGLGQKEFTDDAAKFCTLESLPGSAVPVYSKEYMYDDDGSILLDEDGNPLESGNYTATGAIMTSQLVVRSAVAGKEGELAFDGSEQLLNFLCLNEIQKSSESTHSITISDAHSGKKLAQDVKFTGNVIKGVIHDNLDVEISPMTAALAVWNDKANNYVLTSTGTFSAVLHLADNALKLQTGANEGEDFTLSIGDMSADALGVDRVNLRSRETAGRAITIIDEALDKVLTQRAKLGASQNTLEYTMTANVIAGGNLTCAESRIRDADIAKMMMAFTKLQIKSQAGMSMLSQANQLPQAVLSLIR